MQAARATTTGTFPDHGRANPHHRPVYEPRVRVALDLDQGGQADNGTVIAKRRFEDRTTQNLEIAYACQHAGPTLAGVPLREYEARVPGVGDVGAMLGDWWWKLSWCGHTVRLLKCPGGHDARIVNECCRTPVCANDRAVRARRWAKRAALLLGRLPNGRKWWEVVARLRARGQLTGGVPDGPDPHARMAWRLITIGLRDTGDFIGDVQRTAGPLRSNFNRWLKRRGAAASFLAVDIGPEHGHPHLHIVTYAPFLPKADLQQWLHAQDCDVPGCRHEGDACTGSWDVDIDSAATPDTALAYAATWAPITPGDVEQAERYAAAAIIMYRRPGIETTGLAAPGAWTDHLRVRAEAQICKVCGAPLEECGEGERQDDESMTWFTTVPKYRASSAHWPNRGGSRATC
jgi:hypothetical protein